MIKTHRRTFEARCRQRGCPLEHALPCVISRDGDMWTVDETHPSYPRRGLGDMVKSALTAVGVTEERVSRAIGRPCGCGGRVAALNRLGEKLGISG